jgi:hypothetical protein
MLRRTLVSACAGAVLCLAAGTSGAAANFNGDVNTAINKGLELLDAQGAFVGYDPATDQCKPDSGGYYSDYMRGMPLLALLEKRATGNLNDPPQGYAGASADDQARMRKAVACILDIVNETSFESYYYGNWLMGVALYARTGGPGKGAADIPDDPDLIGLVEAIDLMVDRTITAQEQASCASATYSGMWGYSSCGNDSSTTQFAAAGLAGAKGYYLAKADPGGRATKITAALAKARQAYVVNGSTAGSDNSSCDRIEDTEKGIGYRTSGYNPSLQQTASGLWVQLLGGATVNDNSAQAYVRWLRNHYRWQNLDNMGNSWASNSHWYYMWSAMKGLLTISEGGVTPLPGNLGADAYGKLAPDVDPNPADALAGTCSVRQLNKVPSSVARNTVYGADPGSFYAAESPSTYFDFATTIMSHQCANGDFDCNGAPSAWEDSWDRISWALLVLQRATGGACADLNSNGICDDEEGGDDENAPGDMLCDSNLDGQVTYSDLRDLYGILASTYPVAVPVTPLNAWANYNSTGDSTSTIDINDFWQCYYVSRGKLPILYEGGGT